MTLNHATQYAVTLALVLSTASPSRAQSASQEQIDAQLSWYRDQTETVLRKSQKVLEPHLSDREFEIEQNIKYRVVLSGNVNAQANNIDGVRHVTISAGLIQALSYVVDSYVSDNQLGFNGCFDQYLDYATKRIAQNSHLVQSMQPRRPLRTVFGFANFSPKNACAGLTAEMFKQSSQAMADERGFMDRSIFFIFAHETAHQVLNHTNPDNQAPQDNAEIRRMETAADAWAFRKAFLSNQNPYGAFPAFVFLADFDGSSIEDELLSTHPLGLRRLQSMLDSVSDYYDTSESFKNRLKNAGTATEFKHGLKALQHLVDERMNNLGNQ